MFKPNQPFTVGLWTVKSGSEQEFVKMWSDFAKWTAIHQPGAGSGYLLQDAKNPREFISYGPWESTEAINAWRDRPEFKSFGAKVRELCDDFQPRTLSLVSGSE